MDDNQGDVTQKRILVVDDDPDLLDALVHAIAEEGYAVARARDGREALDYLRTSPPPGLILLDWMMPVMSGEQFCEERARDAAFASIPVLIMTAFRERRAYTYDVTKIVYKPIRLAALLEQILAHFGPAPGGGVRPHVELGH